MEHTKHTENAIEISFDRAILPLSSIVLWFTLSEGVRDKPGHREAKVSLKSKMTFLQK